MHKTKFLCIKVSKYLILPIVIILIQLIFIVIGLNKLKEENSFEEMKKEIEINESNIEKDSQVLEQNNMEMPTQKEEKTITKNQLEEYKNMPKELKGYKVIGKLEIPKINLDTYILSETSTKALKVSVTKLYGPEVNKIGNLCIAGHNYKNMKMFGGIKKLEIDDQIQLTDTFDRKVTYKVYKTYKTSPKDVSCLNQDTGGEREITLITCTAGAIQRVIVKAIEVYD